MCFSLGRGSSSRPRRQQRHSRSPRPRHRSPLRESKPKRSPPGRKEPSHGSARPDTPAPPASRGATETGTGDGLLKHRPVLDEAVHRKASATPSSQAEDAQQHQQPQKRPERFEQGYLIIEQVGKGTFG